MRAFQASPGNREDGEAAEIARRRIAWPGAVLARELFARDRRGWRWLRGMPRADSDLRRADPVHARGVGIVSTAPATEISGQGRVLATLVSSAPSRRVVLMSDMLTMPAVDGHLTSLPLTRPVLPHPTPAGARRVASIVAAIHARAIEVEAIARREHLAALIACTGDPYSLGASALAAGRLGLPFLAYLLDDPIHQWTDRDVRRVARAWAPLWAAQARAVFVPNEVLLEAWRPQCRNVVLVRNAVATPPAAPRDAATETSRRDPRAIVYAGSVYHAQADAIRNLLAALQSLEGRYHLHIYSAQSQGEIAGCGVSGPHVTLHPAVPPGRVPAILASASLLFLPLGFDTGIPNAIRSSSPAKMGEYLAAGRPILAHAPADSHVAGFCRRNDCAILVDRPDPAALAESLSRLAQGDMPTERLRLNALSVSEQFSPPYAARIFWNTLDDAVAIS